MFDIAEEFMYELIPKALFYYLNLEEMVPAVVKNKEQLEHSDKNLKGFEEDVEENKGEEENKKDASNEGENDEVEDENMTEEPYRPTCLLQ